MNSCAGCQPAEFDRLYPRHGYDPLGQRAELAWLDSWRRARTEHGQLLGGIGKGFRALEARVAEPRGHLPDVTGQCAEFCGLQHAHMALTVVVQPKADFELWAEAQRRPAESPVDDKRSAGQAVFAARSCAVCHTVRGSEAAGLIGPDLTHVASRSHIAAGLQPMTRGARSSWIVDPHGHKPGVHMPKTPLSPQDLEAPLDYLESLT
jgi:cytochrome c1